MTIFLYILVGLVAGIFGGLLGIGGGTIFIPALVYIWGFTQHKAQGTTLAIMIPPIGLLAAYRYYLNGNVDLRVALFMALGFLVGGLIGAMIALPIPEIILRKMFGVFFLVIALRMMIF